jgi:HSP20 family protein
MDTNTTTKEVCVMIVRRPSPFGELMTLRQAMDRLFDDDVFRPVWSQASDGLRLPLDVSTTPDALVVEASLPGVKPDDVEITLENNTLTISGRTVEERKSEQGSHLVQEIRRGSFSRSISLPSGLEADRATATFENGMLRLHIPKAEQVKPRRIKISTVTDGTAGRTAETPAISKS